jgi:predicted extracellular nuclease
LIKEGGSGNNNNNVSIYDIQHTTSASGDSPYANQQVSTGGIVNFVRYDGSFYLTSGLVNGQVYMFLTPLQMLIVGDSITLDAEVVEYYNLTELKNINNFKLFIWKFIRSTNITTSSDNANTESFEGCLIKVLDAECTNANGSIWRMDN